MAFGQSSGPPATNKQITTLLELLAAAGHRDFRDARGPMGFTQRQAGGRFTRDEAEAFIERLESEVHGDGAAAGSAPDPTPGPTPGPTPDRTPTRGRSSSQPPTPVPGTLDDVATEELAAELQRRGWVVLEP